MILAWIMVIVLVGVLIAIFSKGNLFKTKTQKSPKTSIGVGTVMEILKKCYAEGKIGKTEFEEKKAELENGVSTKMKNEFYGYPFMDMINALKK